MRLRSLKLTIILYNKRYLEYHSLREEDLGREPSLRSCFHSARETLPHGRPNLASTILPTSLALRPSPPTTLQLDCTKQLYVLITISFARNRTRQVGNTKGMRNTDCAESKQIVNEATLYMLHDYRIYLYCI